MTSEITSDILVIGSGLSGLLFALNIEKNSKYTVNVVTKNEVGEANTKYAQGGVAAVLSQEDTVDEHVLDTLTAGDGLCRKQVVNQFIEDGPQAIQELIDIGVDFNRDESNNLALGREGGHSNRRVAHVNDTTGLAIQNAIMRKIKSSSGIKVYPYHSAIDLVHIRDKIAGAYVLDIENQMVKNFDAKITVLASGGAGKVFLYTSNPNISSGDGIAMAYRAGARIANMEFIQFHPTIYYNQEIHTFLISEALRGEGAELKTIDGSRFMKDIHPSAELAPRDIVARAIDHIMKKTGEDYVHLDITSKNADYLKSRFPAIYTTLLEHGTDLTKEPIPVVPGAHYTIGGVVADINGNTGITGLLAIGEVAHTGFHGANRLASNSLLETAVMAIRSADHAIDELKQRNFENLNFPPWETGDAVDSDEAVIISHNWDELRRLMHHYVGIVRTNKRLLRAKQRIAVLKNEVGEYYWDYHVTSDILELRNIVEVSELIVNSALARKESRGVHYNLDYPDKLKEKRDVLQQRSYGVFYSELFS
ncbi:MAG: L-aspartate oxidase [Candidatus Kariarchaeaceae archaeon]